MAAKTIDRHDLFANVPVPKALFTMAVPTIISQLINLVYNMVDAFFIGRTGNSYMMAATTLTLTLTLLNVAFSNLFGIGGGSLVARLMGAHKAEYAKSVSAFSFFGAIAIAIVYSSVMGLFMDPILRFLGGSDATMGFARSYALIVIVIGTLPTLLSLTLAHLLRNTGNSSQASIGLSMGGLLNVALDPLFMFVILPRGMEVTGAAIATLISNVVSCTYLMFAYHKASIDAPLSISPSHAKEISKIHIKALFAVGVPSALLTGLFDLANICLNIISAAHNDLVLAGMGIVMKLERLPNAVNVGICQGMLPIVAYNFASGNHKRMKDVIGTARKVGLLVSAICILLFELFAKQVSGVFLSTVKESPQEAIMTLGYAALFLRIRCLASPVQFLNYSSSFCMQAMGDGKGTLLHAFVRELGFYIPLMFILDKIFGETGLAAALPIGETLGALFAMYLLHHWLKKHSSTSSS